MQYKDYYAIMGIARDATQDEIKRAYRKLARKYHPDVSREPDAEQKFKEVGEAYEVLKDPEKRVAYDQLGKAGVSGEEFTPPPNWDAGFEFSGGGFTAGDAEAYSDFFESLFGRGAGSSRAHRRSYHAPGEDHHAKVMVDLEDAYSGATRSITLQAPEVDASGHLHTREHTLNVRIPKGIKQGQKIRLAGQGSPGFGEGAAGDLYLEIEFRPHPLYRVEDRDLYLELPVAPWEAALGATVKTPTPTGVVDLKVPPGSSSGRKLRLKGRGIPSKRPGDIYVLLKIALPPADSAKAKSFYEEMQRELPFNPRARLGV